MSRLTFAQMKAMQEKLAEDAHAAVSDAMTIALCAAPEEPPKPGEVWEFKHRRHATTRNMRVISVLPRTAGWIVYYEDLTAISGQRMAVFQAPDSVCPVHAIRRVIEEIPYTPAASRPVEAPKPDPYRERARMPTAAWMAEQDAKHAALVAAHKADLDRSSRERLIAVGGRYGKRVAPPKSWPGSGDDEP